MSFELLALTVEHIPFIYEIRFSVNENKLLPHHIQYLQREMLIDDITQGGGWIAVSGNEYIGFGFGVFIPEPLLGGLFIKPDFQGLGVGSAILNKIEKWVSEKGGNALSLTTDKDSRAEDFYRRNGYDYEGVDEYGQAKYYKILGL